MSGLLTVTKSPLLDSTPAKCEVLLFFSAFAVQNLRQCSWPLARSGSYFLADASLACLAFIFCMMSVWRTHSMPLSSGAP